MYQIIKSVISKDMKNCYFSYKHKVDIDSISADTYGISVTDIPSCSHLDDVTTDEDTALKILDAVSENSITANNLSTFVLDFLSAL